MHIFVIFKVLQYNKIKKVVYILNTLAEREQYVNKLKIAIEKKFSQKDFQVWVFGSFLTDDYTPQSDIDVAIYCADIPLLLDIKDFIDEYLSNDKLKHDIIIFEFNDEHYINIPIALYGKTLTEYQPPHIIEFIKQMIDKWTINPMNVLLERSART